MIGNWVLYKGANTQWDISDYYEIDNSSIMDVIEPIPLSEQWLKDLGFEKDTKGFYYIDAGEYKMEVLQNAFSGTLQKEPNWWISINTGYASHPATVVYKWIHQLQNLYFALTDKQLKK